MSTEDDPILKEITDNERSTSSAWRSTDQDERITANMLLDANIQLMAQLKKLTNNVRVLTDKVDSIGTRLNNLEGREDAGLTDMDINALE